MRGRIRDTSHDTKPVKFERRYTDKDGTTHIWKYDLNKTHDGPISVEIVYPKNYKATSQEQDLNAKFKNAPISQRKWLAPSGKYVGYGRAKQLGLI